VLQSHEKTEEKLVAAYDISAPVKILVGYIKPSYLFKSDILIPIHLGRAVVQESSKDGVISDNDYKWCIENCIGDDAFDGNISVFNRRIGFLTGTYWAWRNYDKLGNPEYFGSFGYRKLFEPSYLENLNEYDMVLPRKKRFKLTLHEQYIANHGKSLLEKAQEILEQLFFDDAAGFTKYMAGCSGYFNEIYVLKRDLFFEFCEWIFPILTEFLNFDCIQDSSKRVLIMINKQRGEKRDLGFIFERLTGYWLYKMTAVKKHTEVSEILLVDRKREFLNIMKDTVNILRNSITIREK
jgi:hypothetical protein